MKKISILITFMIAIGILFSCGITASAANVYTEGGFSYTVSSNGTATITAIDSSVTGKVVVPSTIGGYDVKYFGDTFKNNTRVTSVVLSEGIVSISYYAFSGCVNLEYIYIPATVTSVNKEAFVNTEALKTIEVNVDNSKYLSENGILYNKDKTEILRCPSAISVEKFTFPNSVTKIGAFCFYGNTNIKEVEMPEKLTEIGEKAFYESSVENVQFNDNLLEIKKYAFSSCKNLQSLELPISLEVIGDFAFNNCYSITQLIIPDGVRTIGKEAFNNCDQLINIEIGSMTESIGDEAFGYCSKLQSIRVAESNQYYSSDENGIFFDKNKTNLFTVPPCNSITKYVMPDSVSVIADEAFYAHQTLTEISFSKNLKDIGVRAFFGCEKLADEIYFYASLDTISEDAFVGCPKISSFKVSENNQNFASDAYGALYDKHFVELILYPCAGETTEYIVPATVSVIKKNSLRDADNLRMLVISDSVTVIEETGIYDCDSLENIVIGKGLASISGSAFPYCLITDITVSDENEFFCSVDGVLYSKDKTILYKYPSKKSGENYIIDDTVKTINDGAFVYASKLKNVIVPSNVSEIGYYAFQHCYGLENLTIVNPAVVLTSYLLSTPNTKTTVYGYRNSTAERLCISKNFMFTPLADGLSIDFEDGVLIVSGAEELPVIDDEKMNPWVALAPITECILIEDVSVINESTFASFPDINTLILKSDTVSINDGAFENCSKLKTVISFGDATFSENAFSKETENLLFFAEAGRTVSTNCDVISFDYNAGVVSFDKPVTIEHYDFFNLVAALCDRYPEVNELEFTQFTLLNGNMEKVDINGEEVDRTEISYFENDRLAVQILDEETYEIVTVSFNELCAGVANGEINKFLLVVINEEDEIENEVIVDSDEVKDEESFIVLVFRALITFFNKILRLFKK